MVTKAVKLDITIRNIAWHTNVISLGYIELLLDIHLSVSKAHLTTLVVQM